MSNKFKIIFFLILISTSSFIIGYTIPYIIQDNIFSRATVNVAYYKECNNLSIQETSDCLINYVRPFYNYTIRDDTYATLDDLKANGGDCSDYSKLYNEMARSLGFSSEVVIMKTGYRNKHAVVIISNGEGYCIIDQVFRHCQVLG